MSMIIDHLFSRKNLRKISIGMALSVILIGSMIISSAYGIAQYPFTINNPPKAQAIEETKRFLNDNYNSVEWYPLIKELRINGNDIVVLTGIYPDKEGEKIGQEIANDVAMKNGFRGTVFVYGQNINEYLLATVKK